MEEVKIVKPKKAANKSRSYWQDMVNQWKQSNERQEAFCNRNGIKLGTFTHWRSVFSRETKQKENKFIPVKIIPTETREAEYLTVETPGGFKITLPFTPDAAKRMLIILGITHA